MPLNCHYSFSKCFEDSTFCRPVLQMKRSTKKKPTFYWTNFKERLLGALIKKKIVFCFPTYLSLFIVLLPKFHHILSSLQNTAFFFFSVNYEALTDAEKRLQFATTLNRNIFDDLSFLNITPVT